MGAFDDLIPQGGKKPAARTATVRAGKGAFDDLIPAGGAKRRPAPRVDNHADEDPTAKMSGWERFWAGAGKSLVDTAEGIKQAAVDGMDRNFGGVVGTLDALGADGAADWVAQHGGIATHRKSQQIRNEVADRREVDAPLMRTGAGKSGVVAGNVAQILAPGGVAKLAARVPRLAAAVPMLETIGSAAMPRTVAGNAALGGVVGAVQPVVSDGERTTNAALGTTFGAAGAAIPRAAGGGLRALRATPITRSGAHVKAVRTVQAEAENPAALMQPNPSQVPGVLRSLFEESLDPGVARLETRSRGIPGGGWVERDSANNAARVGAIGQFAGDEAAIAQATTAREAATAPLYRAARQVKDVDTSRLTSQIDRLIEQQAGRPAVQSGLTTIRSLVEGNKDANTLANVRLTLADMLSGKYGGDTGQAMAGSRALMAVKGQLDRVLTKASPEFGQATQTYRSLSEPINRMETGQLLLKRASGSMDDPLTGLPVLSPAKMGSQVKNLDTTARTATGFRKASADKVLRPQDMATINAVNDDLTRSAQRIKYGNGGNSHTASQQELAQRMAARSVARFVPGGEFAMNFLESVGASRLNSALAEVLQNPDQYRAVAARLSTQDRRLLEQALVRVGGTGGAVAATQ